MTRTPFVLLAIVASNAVAQVPIPVAVLREEMRIVSNDATIGTSLTRINEGSAVLPDGRIVTAHSQESIVRVFDSSGRFISMLGGRGEGPGEYRSPSRVGYVGDTIWVQDSPTARRWSLYSMDLKPIGGLPMGGASVMGPNHGMIPGRLYLVTSGRDTAGVTSAYDSSGRPVRRYPITHRTNIHRFEGRDPGLVMDAGSRGGGGSGDPVTIRPPGMRMLSSPLSARTDVALVPGGREMVIVEAGELSGGRPGQVTMRRVNTQTMSVSAPVTVTLPARRVSAQEKDSILEAYARPNPGTADEYKQKARVPEYYPPYLFAYASADGLVWLNESADRRSYVVVDPAGRVLMRVRLPEGLTMFGMNRTHIWGFLTDANDLPVIVRYRIVI